MTTPQTQKLVEEFKEKFAGIFAALNDWAGLPHNLGKGVPMEQVKEWLESSLSLVLKQEKERIVKVIERMKKDEFEPNTDGQIPFAKVKRTEGYNQALSDILKEIID